MLITCPECELKISDKALACPHCGYPIKGENKPRIRKTNKRMRLPNGFGQISQLKGNNLRKPFRAMVTVGKGADGKPICKLLKPDAYFETYNEAYAALVNYNRSPYDLDSEITLKELYEKWSTEYFKDLHPESTLIYKRAWKFCSSIENMLVKDIRARHIKGCMKNGVAMLKPDVETVTTARHQTEIKTLFNLMLDYALEYELVDKNYARTFSVESRVMREKNAIKQEHIPFSEDEIAALWDNVYKNEYIDILLIQCYSGWRPQELGLIKLDSVDLENWKFIGGMKTQAGENREVPIHSRIRPLVAKRYEEAKEIGSSYLFNETSPRRLKKSFKISYHRYLARFNNIVETLDLNPDHRPHDGRKHFITAAKKAKVDEYAIKYIVGHEISDITEKIYTKREFSWLCEEIEKIK